MSTMSFVHLLLVIRDQSCPSECVRGRRRAHRRLSSARCRASHPKVATSVCRTAWGGLGLRTQPNTPTRRLRARYPLEAQKTQPECRDGSCVYADRHPYGRVYMHVFIGKYFWNKYHFNKSALQQAVLNGVFVYTEDCGHKSFSDVYIENEMH